MIVDLIVGLALDSGERPEQPTRASIVHSAGRVPPRWQAFKRCIVARESHGNPRARNPHSSAQGKYQFLDRLWRRPLAGMVAERLTGHGMSLHDARAIRDALRRSEIARWDERLQDVAFAATITVPGNWRHWALSGSRCNGLAS
jgi:hypothetical protein